MKHFLTLFLLTLLIAHPAYASSVASAGGSTDISRLTESGVCTDNHFIRWDDGGGVFQCEAAPGAAGGDAWTDLVDSDIIPDGDDTRDLGSTAVKFAEAHIYDLFQTASGADVTLRTATTNGDDTGVIRSRYRDSNATETCDIIFNAAGPTYGMGCSAGGSGQTVYTYDRSTSTWTWGSGQDVNYSKLTASRALILDGSKNVASSATTSTELALLSGVTGTLTTDDSISTFTNKTIDADGTGNSITNIENADIKAAAAIAVDKLAALTASRAVVSDGSGFVSAATTTATEIGYVNGVTSAIQTQFSGKAPSDGDGIIEDICGHIETPDDKAYWFKVNAPYPFTVNSITTDVDSGTANGQLEIDTVAITGCTSSDIAITSAETVDTCTALNAVAVGEDLTFTISSNSSTDDLRFCVNLTRD